jgi:hypothetical protein
LQSDSTTGATESPQPIQTLLNLDGTVSPFTPVLATSPTKDGKLRQNRIIRKQIKKKIDLGNDDKGIADSVSDFFWSSSGQANTSSFEFHPGEEAPFIDPQSTSAFQFGSPENEDHTNNTSNIQTTQPSLIQPSPIPAIAKPSPVERTKVLRVPRMMDKSRNASSINNNSVPMPAPLPTVIPSPTQNTDKDDSSEAAIKRSKRKKDQAFSSVLDQEDTSGPLDTDVAAEEIMSVSSIPAPSTNQAYARREERQLNLKNVNSSPHLGAPRLVKQSPRNRIREIHEIHESDPNDDDNKGKKLISKKKSASKRGVSEDYSPYSRNSQLLARRRKKKEQWEEKEKEEREKIKEFWLSLTDQERRELVKLEKEAVLKKMKEQQKRIFSVYF